ncbi:hypothetical protein O1C20_003465 [Vibrio cholerae]|nr:hypothetical protein [Vibrio cholerae]ELH0870609.1 hypothetical protein [Vibrio cholerae]
MHQEIKVHYRSNSGKDNYESVGTLSEALLLAKRHRTIHNHMVCIEIDSERTNRWDRSRVKSKNNWRKVDPDEMEVLGQIREIIEG